MREHFIDRKFKGDINIFLPERNETWVADKQQIASAVKNISESYLNAGYSLTLRQLYYQLVAKDLIPNHDKVYKKIGAIKDDCVYGGQVDWDCYEDRSRVPHIPYSNTGIADAIQSALDYFRRDRQEGQKVHVELWTEKDAISDILKKALRKYHIRLCVNKGYTSSSAIHQSYERFCEAIHSGQKVLILYFGDHDPSGLDMIRDIRERLEFMFAAGEQLNLPEGWWEDNCHDVYDICQLGGDYDKVGDIMSSEISESKREKLYELFERGQKALYLKNNDLFEVKQIGLTKDQIKRYNLPPNPAKLTDPRAKGYIREHGNISWEVDALKPEVLTSIVQTEVEEIMDMDKYYDMIDTENAEREELRKIVDQYR